MRKIILTIAAVAVVSSCSIYRKYQRPENVVPVDSLYRAELVSPEEDAQAAEDSTSFGYMPWEEMFTDPHLQALIRQGLDNNTDLLSAALRVQQAQARLTASKWAYSPSLNLSPQVGYNYSLSEGNGAGSGSYNLGGAVSWDIDLFGSLLNAKRGAQAALLQQEAYRQAVRSQLIATIANTYYSLLMLDEQVRVSEENVALWAEQIRSMESMLKVGRVNENAVTQYRAQLYGLEASLADMKRQRQEAENALCSILGSVYTKIERSTIDEQTLPQDFSVGVPLELLSNRPDVYSAEMALASAYYSTNQARSAFYPKLTLSGSAGWTGAFGQAVSNPGGLIINALAQLAQPIFNRGQLTSNLRVAKAEEEIAKLTYKQTLLDAGEEVNNNLYALEIYDEMLRKHQSQLSDLERTVKTAESLYQWSTKMTYLEVLTARQSLLTAQLNVVSDKYYLLQTTVNLYRSLGGGRQ